MASIQISNLYPAGSELFKDSENFMGELVESELSSINGGRTHPTLFSPLCYPTLHSPYCAPVPSRPVPTLPPKL
jgi:hypothetical protein